MHAKNVVHRYIKMDNIMCLPQENEDDFVRIKVMDFGFAHFFKGKEEQNVNLWPGTPAYMAPELYKKEKYGVKVDVWAVGVLVFTLLARDFPFRTQPGDRTPKASVCDKEPNWSALEDISKEGLDFLKKCLDKDKNTRPDVL
jgi:serine/threonine protein kinase